MPAKDPRTIIWHKPNCSTSRKALTLIREAGVEPTIRLYLEDTPSADEIRAVLKAMGTGARGLIRSKEPAYKEQGLDDPALSDDQLIAAMVATPILIERPVVIAPNGTRLGRPVEAILDLLPQASGAGKPG